MNADVIVIGGGVIGTACAYFLSRRGVKVLLLECNHLGAGASGTTAAIVSPSGASGTPEALQRLNIESYRLIPEIEQDFDQSVELIRGGALYAATGEQEVEEIRSGYEEILEMDIEAQWMSGSEARRFEPLLGPGVVAAFYHMALRYRK
jgi:glycine/D-amino acid oxidase-like deaminating enzyme